MAMQTFSHNNITFILLDDIKKSKVNEEYFVGCKSSRKCVERHSIPEDKCLYMNNNKVYTKSYKTAEVFIETDYANDNIMDKRVYQEKKKTVSDNKKKENKQKKEKKENNANIEINETRTERKDIIEEPELVHLEDNEMFLNENGEPMDIEVRGEKTLKGVYFKAYDLGKAFDYSRINDMILHHASGHVYGEHYIYFYSRTSPVNNVGRSNQSGVQNNDNKVLYLTYMGVLKVLFSARGNKAERFQEWVTSILFTMQMGVQDDKDALAAEALNVDQATITQIFRKSARAIPCVYLFEVGTVGNMRQHFQLDEYKNDEDKVYKYGMSSNMARRANEHSKTYGKLKDNSFGLNVFSYIDVLLMSNVETKLKHSFENMCIRVNDPKDVELVVIKKEKLPFIKELFNDIYICCSGNNTDLIRQMQEMQHNHQMEKKDHETAMCLLKSDHKFELQEIELIYLRKMVK
jgi:hypothetical protein